MLTFGSVCSGIEAASVAWEPLGWKAVWFSEIEKFPCEVLKHHYPNVPNLGDMRGIGEQIKRGDIDAPDVLCGGTPCQAFSVAGLRNSLDDARGNLSLTFCELANDIDKSRFVNDEQPAIIFWENVPGVLSTKDNAFGCFLAGLAGESDALVPPGGRWSNAGFIDGPKRAVAWRILDAQYFGVAQRRRRVFVVASARDDFDPAAVLFEFDGVRRDIAPSRQTREGVTSGARAGVASRSWPAEIGSTLDTTFGTKQGLEDQHVNAGCPLFVPAIANAITASMANSCLGHNKDENVLAFDAYNQSSTGNVSKTVAARDDQDTASLLVTHALRGKDFNARQNTTLMPVVGAICKDSFSGGAGGRPEGAATGHFIVAAITDSGQANAEIRIDDISTTLTCLHEAPIALAENTIGRSPENGGNGNGFTVGGPMYTLNCTGVHGVAQTVYEMHGQDSRVRELGDTCTTVTSTWGAGGGNVPITTQPIPIDTMNMTPGHNSGGLGFGQPGDPSFTLTKGHSHAVAQPIGFSEELNALEGIQPTIQRGGQGGRHEGVMQTNMAVRRLTPVECERLQGFPDGYTDIKSKGKPTPDGPRYKALGNSWAVPVVRWIGERIARAT